MASITTAPTGPALGVIDDEVGEKDDMSLLPWTELPDSSFALGASLVLDMLSVCLRRSVASRVYLHN